MALRILHCVEFYHPSPGGAQAVMQHVSEELVRRGHQVTVATTRLPERKNQELNGVRIEEFQVSGNAVRGLHGEVERYQRFVVEGDFDLVMTYAAQQWTTDALLPCLERIPYRKLLAPCGFSGLADPTYQGYFESLPALLAKFDHLIFHSDTYQDIKFARERSLANLSVIPNGASRAEFEEPPTGFRERHGIPLAEPLLLTVGPHNWLKGHRLALESYARTGLDRGTFAVVGNKPLRLGCQWDCRARALAMQVRRRGRQRIVILDLPRDEVLAAFAASDLFVFTSQVESFGIVLMEAAASGTPFISVDCGSAEEIAAWTGAGEVVPSERRSDGRVIADPQLLAERITALWHDAPRRRQMTEAGRAAWLREFTWERIAKRYEDVYRGALATAP